MFDAIPISMEFVSEIEAVALQSSFKPVCIIDEKHGVIDIMFLAEFFEEDFGQSGRIRGKKTNVEEFVRAWIDSSVQPVLLIVDANHAFIQRNLIRSFTTVWL